MVEISQIRRDLKAYTEQTMSANLTFTSPNAVVETIKGFGTAHHLSFDSNTGRPINTKNAHCSFFEKTLSDLGYPVRVSNEVSMKNHRVSFLDSAGITRHYRINETFPDETLGMIVCILGEEDAS